MTRDISLMNLDSRVVLPTVSGGCEVRLRVHFNLDSPRACRMAAEDLVRAVQDGSLELRYFERN